jgi:hypothetical protein
VKQRNRPRTSALGAVIATLAVAFLAATPGITAAATAPHGRTQGHRGLVLAGYTVIHGKRYPVVRDPELPALPRRAAAARTASGFDPNIVNNSSGKCLDVANYGTSNLDNVQQWTCHNPQTQNQLWSFYFVENYVDQQGVTWPVYNIKEHGTNECLDAYNWGVKDGTNVDIYNCAPASQRHGNQLWIPEVPGGPSHVWNLAASADRGQWVGLDVVCTSGTGYGMNNGANVQLWHDTLSNSCGGDNQLWDW